ncbi:MAG TPA: NADH-quinone oxidoreductase subunit A [Candidatus Xenobia bacterium]|jgi:NADH:ubiquinone oxidoreductase subunit 3 (subunit A)
MIGGAGLLAGGGIVTAGLLSPRKPDPVKESTYECGQEPFGPAWVQYNVRYYLFAMVFVLFDVETVFVAPWAVSFKQLLLTAQLHSAALMEMVLFLAFLILALVYAWRKGVLEWT